MAVTLMDLESGLSSPKLLTQKSYKPRLPEKRGRRYTLDDRTMAFERNIACIQGDAIDLAFSPGDESPRGNIR